MQSGFCVQKPSITRQYRWKWLKIQRRFNIHWIQHYQNTASHKQMCCCRLFPSDAKSFFLIFFLTKFTAWNWYLSRLLIKYISHFLFFLSLNRIHAVVIRSISRFCLFVSFFFSMVRRIFHRISSFVFRIWCVRMWMVVFSVFHLHRWMLQPQRQRHQISTQRKHTTFADNKRYIKIRKWKIWQAQGKKEERWKWFSTTTDYNGSHRQKIKKRIGKM